MLAGKEVKLLSFISSFIYFFFPVNLYLLFYLLMYMHYIS